MSESNPAPQVVVNIHGGVVQDVYCDEPLADLVVVDWDTSPDDEGITEAAHNGELLRAYVTHPIIEPRHRLAGSDLEAIVDAADAVEPAETATSGAWEAARR